MTQLRQTRVKKNQDPRSFLSASPGSQRPAAGRPGSGASLTAQLTKNPPAMQETLVQFLGWEDLLEKG